MSKIPFRNPTSLPFRKICLKLEKIIAQWKHLLVFKIDLLL